MGKALVRALLAAGFKVTVITREESTHSFPEEVEVRRFNGSFENMCDAMTDQDAVVSAVGGSAIELQDWWAESARAVHVKRFIPSEFGHNTRPGKLSGPMAQLLAGKTRTVDELIKITEYPPGYPFAWTGVATGLCLDLVSWSSWEGYLLCILEVGLALRPVTNELQGLDNGVFGIDIHTKTANIVDSGNEPVAVSSLAFVAQSVVAVLQRADETANQYIDVIEHTVTQNQLLRIFEEETGVQFAVTHTSSSELSRIANQKLAQEDRTAFREVLKAYNLADGAGRMVDEKELWNERLGLGSADLRATIREYIRTRCLDSRAP